MKTQIFKIRVEEEFLRKDQQKLDDFLGKTSVIRFETAFVQDKNPFWSVILYYEITESKVRESKTEKYSADHTEILNSDEHKILEALKLWRSEKAREQSLPSYFIASNNELTSVAKFKPAKKEELQEIKGFGKHKIENYGTEIIRIIESV